MGRSAPTRDRRHRSRRRRRSGRAEPSRGGRGARAGGGAAPRRVATDALGARSLLPVVVGAGLIVLRLAVVPAGPAALDVPPTGDGPWTLVVVVDGLAPRRTAGRRRSGRHPDAAVPFTVAATLPRYPVVDPGRSRRSSTVGSCPRPDSPYGSYLERIGAAGTLQSRTIRVEPVPDDPGRRLEALRRGAAEALARVLPEPEAGLAAGILIGLRDAVDRDLAAAFTTAGVSHVVAISGWNIAIVAAAIAALTGRLGRRRRSVVTDRRDRRVCRVRGRLTVGRARRADGRRRPAGARDAAARGVRARRSAGPRRSCSSAIRA